VSYEILFGKAADRDLGRLSPDVQRCIVSHVAALTDSPRPQGAEPLHGRLRGLMKLRVGHYRISYEIDDEERLTIVMEIGHRWDIYRRLERRR